MSGLYWVGSVGNQMSALCTCLYVYVCMYMCIYLSVAQVGHSVLSRQLYSSSGEQHGGPLLALNCQLPVLEAVMMCVERGWMTILVRFPGDCFTCFRNLHGLSMALFLTRLL